MCIDQLKALQLYFLIICDTHNSVSKGWNFIKFNDKDNYSEELHLFIFGVFSSEEDAMIPYLYFIEKNISLHH